MGKVWEFLNKAPTVLRKWRVIKISIVALLGYVLWEFKDWIMQSPYAELDSSIQSVVVSVVIIGLITGLFAVANKADEPHRRDEDDHI